MILSGNKVLFIAGVLGFMAAIYMIISNIFFNKDFSAIAIGAGLISPLYFYILRTKDKLK